MHSGTAAVIRKCPSLGPSNSPYPKQRERTSWRRDLQQHLGLPKREKRRTNKKKMTRNASSGSSSSSSSSSDGTRSTSHKRAAKQPRRWTPQENEALRIAVERHGESKWKAIAKDVGTRDHVQCLQRWKKVEIPGLVKGQWKAEEDRLLVMAKKAMPSEKMGAISAKVPGRTSKQCRERWCHHLDPALHKNNPFTAEEDMTLIAAHAELDDQWDEIALRLPGRSANSVNYRCKALLEKSVFAPPRHARTPGAEGFATNPRSTPASSPSSALLPKGPGSTSFGAPKVDNSMVHYLPLSERLEAPAPVPRRTTACVSRELCLVDEQPTDSQQRMEQHPVEEPCHGDGLLVGCTDNTSVPTSAPHATTSATSARSEPISGSGSVGEDEFMFDEIDLEALLAVSDSTDTSAPWWPSF